MQKMVWWQIVLGVVLIIASIIIIALIMLQESRQGGLSGAISGGGADSFLGKGKSRSREATLARFTKVIAVIFCIVTLITSLLFYFL